MTGGITAQQHRDVLTELEAGERAKRVANCRYEIAIDITRGSETYGGEVTIEFELSGTGDLFLDFRGKTIRTLEVNGAGQTPEWTGYRLTLPAASLGRRNRVRMVYENDYDHGGDGFHQFKDPEDGEEYLYTNFEPYEAHRLFPCFDQPDIKATYRLTVTAPSGWEVVANSRETAASTTPDGRRRHEFEGTKAFSTYLFALIAGPYHVARDTHGGIELGLFCRKSLVKYLDTDELFTISKQGLDFFGKFFDLPYPFGKYDQLFVPEFNAGAMENVGAVTHNEYMVFRDRPTDNQRRRRAETVLHEMAHMWFGDLVTMRWWNDLWLNESFATYMAYLAMTEATRFTSAWQDFNASIKNWAYRQDQLVTTHPIAGQVADTDATFLNFDGITYGKGASVLKQLVATIGMDGFREGMRHYFRTHAYGNATLAQFLASLEAGSGQDLKEWSRAWLETASVNTIAAQWEADGDRVTRLALLQTAQVEYPTLRPHHVEVGLIREEGGGIAVDTLPVALWGEQMEIPAALGLRKPALVFPNYNDQGYAKVALDPESLAFVRSSMEKLDDALLRQLLWSSLWSMVRDQQLKSTEFLALVRQKLPLEPEVALVDSVLAQALAALTRFVPDEWREREAHALFERSWEALRSAAGGDAQIVWGRALIGCAIGREDLELVGSLADGRERVGGFNVDQEMRWSIAAKFVAYGMAGASERVGSEVKNDPSDRGERARLRAATSEPSAAVKAAAWERFLGEGYGSLYLTGAAMSGFNWSHQRELLEPYVERFFAEAPGVFRREEKEFMSDYFGALFPAYRVDQAVLDRSEQLLAEAGDELPVLARMLREANDELGRSIRCRAFARA